MTCHCAPTDESDIEAFIRVLTKLANRDDAAPEPEAEAAATVAEDEPAAAGS